MVENTINSIDISPFKSLYPFTSNFININGLKYHYIDKKPEEKPKGKLGEPVLMVHGNPTWSFYYRNLVKTLSDRHRTIVPDHIGCGLSDKPGESDYNYTLKNRVDDLESLIDTLALKDKITLIVHDWGGAIGMTYALRHIESIKKIVILNTAAFFPPDNKPIPLRLKIIRNSGFPGKILVQGFNLFSFAALYMASKKGLSANVKKGLKAPYNSWKNRIATLKFVHDIPVNEDDPAYKIIKNLDENLHKLSDIPMLICWGMQDFVFDKTYCSEWEKRFPKAIVHKFENAGHYILEDEPEKTSKLISEFLKTET